jgi:hypothetical protein
MRKYINLVESVEEAVSQDIDNEVSTPSENDEMERIGNLEHTIKKYCEKKMGWDMSSGYSVNYDAESGELAISPNEGEVTFEQLTALNIFGNDITISAASSQWKIHIIIKTPKGFSVSVAETVKESAGEAALSGLSMLARYHLNQKVDPTSSLSREERAQKAAAYLEAHPDEFKVELKPLPHPNLDDGGIHRIV